MKQILDLEDKSKEESSWKLVLIMNGILLCIPLYFCYYYSFIETSDRNYQIENIIIYSLFFTCIWTVIVNILFLFISLFFSKKYWKKWLIMVGFCVILFFITLLIQLIIDISKFDFLS